MKRRQLPPPFGLANSPPLSHHPIFDKTQLGGWRAMHKEADLPLDAWKKEVEHALATGLPAAVGLEKVAEIALETAWDGVDAVYILFDIDSVDCGFVPGTGWPEPGGFLPREILYLLGAVAKEGICGMEVVEVSPPYDVSDITSLLATRAIVDVLGTLVAYGKLGTHRGLIRDAKAAL